jgi:hypothetical protein
MFTRKPATIHQSVVALLKRAGYSPIEAERLWDTVYSKQYTQAPAGVTTTWVIGEYTFEFTKVQG